MPLEQKEERTEPQVATGNASDASSTCAIKTFESLDDLSGYLDTLQQKASTSLANALAAQMQVIRYVNTPVLIGSSFDLFFKYMKTSIQSAESEFQCNKLREICTLMVHNFIFFMNVRLEAHKQQNTDDCLRAFASASKDLVVTATKLAVMALPAGEPVKLALESDTFNIDDVKNVAGHVSKFVTLFGEKMKIAKEERDMNKTIMDLLLKFHKYRKLIGQNELVVGIVERYRKSLLQVVAPTAKGNLTKKKVGGLLGFGTWISILSGPYYIIIILAFLTHWGSKLLGGTGLSTVGLTLLTCFALIPFVLLLIHRIKCSKLKRKVRQEQEHLAEVLTMIAKEFSEEDFDDSIAIDM